MQFNWCYVWSYLSHITAVFPDRQFYRFSFSFLLKHSAFKNRKCLSNTSANSLPPTQVVMPLHLEKVRDKLAENIHELWGMNKIELGWSYGKVRSTCICVVGKNKKTNPHSGIHEHFFPVCGETNITAERFFCFLFFKFPRCLSCMSSLKCIRLLAPFS